jgi:glycosyltransferase involved in cell wall biosynthesis
MATVFVLPSRHEPWGLIVNEVMNAGRAVIVSDDVGSQADLVEDGVEGCVFPV